jgi:hypothetical protein
MMNLVGLLLALELVLYGTSSLRYCVFCIDHGKTAAKISYGADLP